jgi:hypothetical protein
MVLFMRKQDMKLGTKLFASAIAAVGVLGLASRSFATVTVNMTNPAGAVSTVRLGDIITIHITAATDNVNGIATVGYRVNTSLASIGGAVDSVSPFHAVAMPSDPNASNLTTVSQAFLETLGPGIADANHQTVPTLVLFSGTQNGYPIPSTSTTNRVTLTYTGFVTAGQRGPDPFGGANVGIPQVLADVSYRAVTLGTVYFSLMPNLPLAQEYSSSSGTGSVAATTTGTGGFQVNIVAGDVPEPASLGVLSLGGLALLARRRRRA